MTTDVDTMPLTLAGNAWRRIQKDADYYGWPEAVLDAGWVYTLKLTERCSGSHRQDRTEVSQAANGLNTAERTWKRSCKRTYIARVIRNRIEQTCRAYGITDDADHKIFAPGVFG